MAKKRIKLVLLLLLILFRAVAQDIEVKKFELLEKDHTAALSPRKDINGVTCGLVKVLLKEPGAEFEGSVIFPMERSDWVSNILTICRQPLSLLTMVPRRWPLAQLTS